MNFFVCLISLALCVCFTSAGRPSTKYLPPNYAGSASAPQRYQGVAPGSTGSHHYGGAASHSSGGHNSQAARIPILRNDYTNDGNGNYNFGFETGNGIKRDETGQFQGGWPHGSLNVQGSYSYKGDDGKVYSVNYKADKNGFHAEGDHLPTSPPIPREIQETLHLHQHKSGSAGGHHGGGSYGGQAGGHHAAAASHQAPSASYLPPQAHSQGYNYGGKRHY